ncbi:unnamed protein product [Coffea canephora]|uniref:mitogen-activated protein kinase kinase n=1 Tax=Coffea canephora TaxID=49390 RepID=A0A068U5P5_COFCA|nr:unnamed protein product [Coffea canephora]
MQVAEDEGKKMKTLAEDERQSQREMTPPSNWWLPMVDPPPGVPTIYLADYEYDTRLGWGSIGYVDRVRHKPTGRLYALKAVRIHDHQRCQNRVREYMALAPTLEYRSIVKCHGVQTERGYSRLLYDLMTSPLSGFQTHDMEILSHIADNILFGLQYLRKKNIVFKFLSPSNIFYDDADMAFKIGDVGAPKDLLFDVDCQPVPNVEAERYVAPELLSYTVRLSVEGVENWDVWSLGMCLLEFYLGKFPIDYDKRKDTKGLSLPFFMAGMPNPPRAPPEAWPPFRHFIELCLQRSPADRASVDQLLSHEFVLTFDFEHQEGKRKNEGDRLD